MISVVSEVNEWATETEEPYIYRLLILLKNSYIQFGQEHSSQSIELTILWLVKDAYVLALSPKSIKFA